MRFTPIHYIIGEDKSAGPPAPMKEARGPAVSKRGWHAS